MDSKFSHQIHLKANYLSNAVHINNFVAIIVLYANSWLICIIFFSLLEETSETKINITGFSV